MNLRELLEKACATVSIVNEIGDIDILMEIEPEDCNFRYCLSEEFLNQEIDVLYAEKDKLIVVLREEGKQ